MLRYAKLMTGKTVTVLIILTAFQMSLSTMVVGRTLWDHAAYTYIGQTILKGGLPYRDAFDVKGPGGFFISALSILLFGKSVWALRLFDLVWESCTALCLAHLGSRVFKRQAVGLLAGLIYLTVYYGQKSWLWAQPDALVNLPLAVSIVFLVGSLETDRSVFWALAGACLGVATLFKLPFGLLGIAFLIVAVRRDTVQPRQILRRFGALASGYAAPLLLCSLYFYLKGGLGELLVAQFVFAPEYIRRVHHLFSFRCVYESAILPDRFPLYVLGMVGVSGLLLSPGRKQKVPLAAKLLVVWLGVAILTLVLQSRWDGAHHLPLIAPLAVLSAQEIHVLSMGHRTKRSLQRKILLAIVALSLAIPVRMLGRHALYAWHVLSGDRQPESLHNLGIFLRQHTTPVDRIFVWGNTPEIYLQADRESASRFIAVFYLSVPWQKVDFRKTFLAEFAANKPRYFVLIKPMRPGRCGAQADTLEAYYKFDALRKIVDTEYEAEQNTELYTLFRRKKSSLNSGDS